MTNRQSIAALVRTIFSPRAAACVLAAVLPLACAAAPPGPGDDEKSATSSQAICGNGVHPGCGACLPVDGSTTVGSRTCWTCDGDSYTQSCSHPVICGGQGQDCCPPTVAIPACNSGLSCDNGVCSAPPPCGGRGQACCAGERCDSGYYCDVEDIGISPSCQTCDYRAYTMNCPNWGYLTEYFCSYNQANLAAAVAGCTHDGW